MRILFSNDKGYHDFWIKFLKRYDLEKKIKFYSHKPSMHLGSSCRDADVVIYGCFGTREQYEEVYDKNPNARKIFWSTEHWPGTNLKRLLKDKFSNIGLWDASFTFEYDAPEYNNTRLPFWVYHIMSSGSQGHQMGSFNPDFTKDISELNKNKFPKNFNEREFCSFVASRSAWQSNIRNSFYKSLNEQEAVDLGGRALNGKEIKDKIKYQSQFKFAIAFENASHLGYTTEKILDAYKSRCIPIYWGNPAATTDFNSDTFINAHQFKNTEDIIEYILKVYYDINLYKSYFNNPILNRQWLERFVDPDEKYFKHIFKLICPML